MLLTSRKLVQRKLMDIESDMRGTLRNFGLKVGVVSSIRYEARIRDLVEGFPRLAAIIEPLLTVRRVMRSLGLVPADLFRPSRCEIRLACAVTGPLSLWSCPD